MYLQNAGLEAARTRGRIGGRPKKPSGRLAGESCATERSSDLQVDHMGRVDALSSGDDPLCNQDSSLTPEHELDGRRRIEHDHRESRSFRMPAAAVRTASHRYCSP